MSLMLSRETARLLYDLALASKQDPSALLTELIKRAAEEQRGSRQTECIIRPSNTTETEVSNE